MYLKKEACACLVACLALFGLILSQHPVAVSLQASIATVGDGSQPPLPPPTSAATPGPLGFAGQGMPVLVADGPEPPPPPPTKPTSSSSAA